MNCRWATDLASLFGAVKPDVVVDFTNAEGGTTAMRSCIAHGVRCVSGSTGISPEELAAIGESALEAGVGVISASNFALGCVVLIHLARIASSYFDYADVIESHHEMKIDAPSGTALSIVQAMLEGKGGDFDQNIVEKELLAGTRGGSMGGINVHSARMPGRVARHEVVFGALGQTLTLLHDSVNRESFHAGRDACGSPRYGQRVHDRGTRQRAGFVGLTYLLTHLMASSGRKTRRTNRWFDLKSQEN